MLRMASKVSDRLASKFVERVDAGACYPPDFCFCAQQACPGGVSCSGARYQVNCVGKCVVRGGC